ncbi:MAG: hypothetical protein LBU18_00160, partial [Treponema sp.]|nr:hypothetical protein [Treponema sp.]
YFFISTSFISLTALYFIHNIILFYITKAENARKIYTELAWPPCARNEEVLQTQALAWEFWAGGGIL